MISVIERDPDTGFSTGKEKTFADGIFTNGIGGPIAESIDDELPCLTAIVSAIDVRLQIVDAETADRSVCSVVVEVRGLDLRDFAPAGELGRSDVLPVLAVVASDPDFAIVGAGPDGVDVLEGG